MATVALQQVSSKFARENASRTLEKPIGLKFVQKFLDAEIRERLESSCQDGKVYVWGAKLERIHQFAKMLPKKWLVLFRRGTMIYKCGVVLESAESLELAERLWGFDSDGETWGLIYFLKNVRAVAVPAGDINKVLGRAPRDHWQGLTAVPIRDTEEVIAFIKAELEGRPGSGAQPTPTSARGRRH